MNRFKVDRTLCVNCGQCAADCLVRIIDMTDEGPAVTRLNGVRCMRCLHCLAVCPKGAISVAGVGPQDCLPVQGELPSPEKMERLVMARRSFRRYKKEDVDPLLIERLLAAASYAPTGKNVRRVRFTVINTRAAMDRFRDEAMTLLAERASSGALPAGMEFLTEHLKRWQDGKVDSIFRGAPHWLIASAPKDCPTPEADCLIALSYFELLAQASGVGTVWTGVGTRLIGMALPELREKLGIPADHVIGYAMAFGMPVAGYPRTVRHKPFETVKISS